ncbi:26s proteasome non-ATPase regulatory subunit [Cyclospora cayetanensis]|uniref:26s proteasome non-ATPase regulatory subunit n=1 Tax=Cyclospora cayetanensis TaxID=88456 RepID=A0A1D3CRP5_9EIME|nr:26s proteasome non-ATPase regulatory subunit [Cyclospora cayetanensis]
MLEERMEAIASFLTSEGMPGLKGPLVDEEGFPRADIDVHAVRSARNQLACLQTDYREVQRKLEEILLRVHAESAKAQIDQQDLRAPKQPDTTEVAGEQDEVPPPPIEDEGPAFAVVDVLQPGGPSGIAGIAAGDRVLRLGTLRLPVGRNAAAGSTQNHRKGPLPGGDSSSRALTATQIFELLPGEVARYENEQPMPLRVALPEFSLLYSSVGTIYWRTRYDLLPCLNMVYSALIDETPGWLQLRVKEANRIKEIKRVDPYVGLGFRWQSASDL